MAKRLILQHPEIKVEVMTVKKSNVQEHIRRDANKLYNYMVGLVIPDHVKAEEQFELLPDERSIKVKSQNSLADYLQIKLWFEIKCQTAVICTPATSSQNYDLQFTDWLAHCIWVKYEDAEEGFFNILRPVIKLRELFFFDPVQVPPKI